MKPLLSLVPLTKEIFHFIAFYTVSKRGRILLIQTEILITMSNLTLMKYSFKFYHLNRQKIITSLSIIVSTGRVPKVSGCIHHCKILPGNIFGPFEKQDGCHGHFLSVMKSASISLLLVLEVWHVKPIYRISWAGNLLMWSDLTLGPSFKVK